MGAAEAVGLAADATDTPLLYGAETVSSSSSVCLQLTFPRLLLLPAPLELSAQMGNHGSSLDDILAEDMHHWYNKFMRESPSGLITLFELKAILGLKGMNENANSYVDQVFFTFDMDGVRHAHVHTHTH